MKMKTHEQWNESHVLAAIGLYGDSLSEIYRVATREVVDEHGKKRRLMTDAEVGTALTSLLASGKITRTGVGQRASFSITRRGSR